MNARTVISKCFSLVYRENQLADVTNSNKEFVINTISDMDLSNDALSINPDCKKLIDLRDMIVRMCQYPANEKFDCDSVLQELKIACDDDAVLFSAIYEDIAKDLSEEEIQKKIMGIRRDLTNNFKEEDAKKVLGAAYNELRFNRGRVTDLSKFFTGLVASLDQYTKPDDDSLQDKAIMSAFSLTDRNQDQALQVLQEIKDDAKGESVLKFPWQCMNRMTAGGLRRGQTTVVGALQHHNKSGFCLAACIGFCLYNDPKTILTDKKKKPLILYISLENEPKKIAGDVYSILKGNFEDIEMTQKDLEKIKPSEALDYMASLIGRTGYHFQSMRVNPGEWTYLDLFNTILWYESQGYEIHACCVDYLNQIQKTGCFGKGAYEQIQDLFNKVRNFMAKKNIAFITPHQLSAEALELHRQGRTDLATIVAGGNYYADCKGIGREVDLELFLYIAKLNGLSYQCIARGKHRLIAIVTPQEYHNYILPFSPYGGLRYDVDKGSEGDTSLKKLGQKRNSEGNVENPWWESDEEVELEIAAV